jgi:hypothetical protein
MWVFTRGSKRLSITIQAPTELVIRTASIERRTFASPEDLGAFKHRFERFLCRHGWTLFGTGVDRRADILDRATPERALAASKFFT